MQVAKSGTLYIYDPHTVYVAMYCTGIKMYLVVGGYMNF